VSKKTFTIAVLLLLIMTSLLFAGKGRHQSVVNRASSGIARVEKTYDGDTIAVFIDGRLEKIRLIGIDAPEMSQRPWGRRAKKCLETLIEDTDSRISLEYDIERRDKYGRLLAYVWTQDGKMINEEMMKKGCAVLFTFPPNVRYVERFRAAQKIAQGDRRGVWGEDGLKERPYDYRKVHPRK
jgi:micrococcal nuclease